MTDKVIDLDMRSKEQKKEERRRKRKESFDSVVKWLEEHWVLAAAFLTALASVLGAVIKALAGIKRSENVKEEKRLKENFIYDRRRGHYIEVRRKPSANQWMEIDNRYDDGESMAEILDDLNLIK